MSNPSLWELLKHATALQDANPGLNTAEAIRKVLDIEPGLYSPVMPPPAQPERETVSKRDQDARKRLVREAERVQKREPHLSWQQAVNAALDANPNLAR